MGFTALSSLSHNMGGSVYGCYVSTVVPVQRSTESGLCMFVLVVVVAKPLVQ